MTNTTHTKSITRDPEATASVLASIPDCLKDTLLNSSTSDNKGRKSVLISSNNLANRFILSRWRIRPSQRRRYKNLFTSIRKHCRIIFNHYLLRGRIEWIDISGKHLFGVYKFDEVRGNLILGFVTMTPESEWTLSNR
ncbi:hypothetical protein E4H12_01260 [Candidatus Thorarchaeota archaeon]|nr:hypothetical protein [Candidatus Thorarchaeota archaeon]TFG99829.1 MAG: hypothetical protein E4H12_01260 [Candidatus Thorarchaeota archaeon]